MKYTGTTICLTSALNCTLPVYKLPTDSEATASELQMHGTELYSSAITVIIIIVLEFLRYAQHCDVASVNLLVVIIIYI